MLIKEKLVDSTLFDTISSKINWVETVSGQELYFMYIHKYGDRVLISSLETVDVDLIATGIISIYATGWNIIYSKLSSDILPDNGNEKITYKENVSENSTQTTSDNENTITKVSAYNDDSFANDESSSNIKDGNTINDNTSVREYTKTRTTTNTVTTTDDYLKMLLKNNICDIIFTNINDFISTKVMSLEV